MSFVESYAPADQGGYKSGMSPHDKYHCWAATQYKSKVCRISFNLKSLISKPYSLMPTSLANRGHHQHLQKVKWLIHRAGHPLHKAYGSHGLEYAPTCATNLLHPQGFPVPPTPLRLIWIRRVRTNNTLRDLGRLMHRVLRISHLPKVDVTRASGTHPQHQ